MKVNMLSDEELFDLLKSDEFAFQAFTHLYNRFWELLYSAAYKRLKSREVSEEIVQDFFTKLWINRKEISITTSAEGYIFTSIKYLVLGYIDKETVRNKFRALIDVSESSLDDSTQEKINLNELVASIDKQVQSLPPKCRSVFELSRTEYKTNKEIASELGISEKTVENHLTKALKRLRLNLSDSFLLLFFLLGA